MNYLDALKISASGLSAQRLRMNLIADNLANADSTRSAQGGPYRKKEAVFASVPFAAQLEKMLSGEPDRTLSEVRVVEIIEDQGEPLLKYDPQHPDADEQGYVAYPRINAMEQMVNLMTAARSYEANVRAADTTKRMALKALEIGK